MKHITLVISALILLVTESLVGQTTYDLPTGKSLVLNNGLPDYLHPYFDESRLVQIFSSFEPAADYFISIVGDDDTGIINLTVAVPDFDPQAFRDVIHLTDEAPCFLNTVRPSIYMTTLTLWYAESYNSLPARPKLLLAAYELAYNAVLVRDDKYLIFQGVDANGYIEIYPPIKYVNDEYGLIEIYPGTTSNGAAESLIAAGRYPLDPPRNSDGGRNTSWLVYDFFDAVEE